MSCSCSDYSRSALLRGAAAQAGRGLPAIEPGMPVPAGTGLTRRTFMSRAAGMAFAVYGAASLGPKAFEAGIAQAAAAAPDQRILVSVFLSGGADSLSVLAPTGDPRYASLRPTLKLSPGDGTQFAGDPRLRWHPAAGDLATLHGEGKLTVMPAIGYTGANQSHFTSRHYYEVGETNPSGRWGWLGRFLDQHGAADNPLQGLTLGYELQPALAAQDVPVATVSRPDDYEMYAPGVWNAVADPMLDSFGALGDLPTSDNGLAYARGAVAATGRLRGPARAFPGRLQLAGALPGHRLRRPPRGPRRDDQRKPASAGGGHRGRRQLRHALGPGAGALVADRHHERRAAGLPEGSRGAWHRGPRARPRVERVRAATAGERLGHRPRRGGSRLRDGTAGLRRDGWASSRAWLSWTRTTTCARPPTSVASTRR